MINFNGDILPEGALFLNSRNSAFHYGDAIVEWLRFSGDRLLFLETHYFRLMSAMRQLRMEIPMSFTPEFWESQMLYTLNASGITSKPAQLKVSIFRNEDFESGIPIESVRYIIECLPLQDAAYTLNYSNCNADIFKDYLMPVDGLSSLPLTGGPLRKLAKIYILENGFDTAILLNQRKEVCETLDGALFIRFDNLIVTPPEDSGCRLTILREQLMQYINKNEEFNLEIRSISPFDLQKADEIFSVSEYAGFRSVNRFRKTTYSTSAAERLSQLLNASIFSKVS